jgi:hypothetical protein
MKLIKINTDHYVIVDDSEIKEGDFVINIQRNHIYPTPVEVIDVEYRNRRNDVFKKITHSTQPIEANSLHRKYDFININPLSLSEVKELIGEINEEKNMWYERNTQNPYPTDSPSHTGFKKGFELGYNQSLEDNQEKKYTEDDLAEAILRTIDACNKAQNDSYGELEIDEEAIIQSIQPKTEWDVEIVDNKLKLK